MGDSIRIGTQIFIAMRSTVRRFFSVIQTKNKNAYGGIITVRYYESGKNEETKKKKCKRKRRRNRKIVLVTLHWSFRRVASYLHINRNIPVVNINFFFHFLTVNSTFFFRLIGVRENKGKKNPFEMLNNSIESGGGHRWRIRSGTALIFKTCRARKKQKKKQQKVMQISGADRRSQSVQEL